MPHLQFTRREWFVMLIVGLLVVAFISAWVGERFRPFSLAIDVGDYVAQHMEERALYGLPTYQPTVLRQRVYVVQSGDTVYGIADKFGVHEVTLRFKNEIGEDSVIHVGQELIIPEFEQIH